FGLFAPAVEFQSAHPLGPLPRCKVYVQIVGQNNARAHLLMVETMRTATIAGHQFPNPPVKFFVADLTLAMCSTLAASDRIFYPVERDHSLRQDRQQPILIHALTAASTCKRRFQKIPSTPARTSTTL